MERKDPCLTTLPVAVHLFLRESPRAAVARGTARQPAPNYVRIAGLHAAHSHLRFSSSVVGQQHRLTNKHLVSTRAGNLLSTALHETCRGLALLHEHDKGGLSTLQFSLTLNGLVGAHKMPGGSTGPATFQHSLNESTPAELQLRILFPFNGFLYMCWR